MCACLKRMPARSIDRINPLRVGDRCPMFKTAFRKIISSVALRRFPDIVGSLAGLLAASWIPGASAEEQASAVASDTYSSAGRSPYQVARLRKGSPTAPWRVVIVPGTPSTVEGWRETLERGRGDIEFIAIERLGFGKSEPRDAVLDFDDQLLALEPLVNERPGRTILVGHSLGGPLVLHAALAYSDKVAAVVSLAGSFDPELEEIHPLQHVGRWWGIRHVLPRLLRNSNEELFAHKEELTRLAGRLGQVEVPVVIVHGTDDSLVPYENSDFLMERLPEGLIVERRTLDGVGHVLQSHSVDAVLRGIDRVIELVEGDADST